MKLLFVDVCARYLNPTNTHIPTMLRMAHQTVFYGPGFVSDAELGLGLQRFIDRHGPFDFILTTRLSWKFSEGDFASYWRYSSPSYHANQLIKFGDDVESCLSRTSVRKIIFLTALDVYALTEATAAKIAKIDAHFVIWANGFSRPTSELAVFTQEEFYARKGKTQKLGLWHEFVHEHAKKFINFGHFVAHTEFDWTSLDGRSHQVVVPGQRYVRRQAARNALKAHRILHHSGSFRRAMSLMDRVGLRPYTRPILLNAYHVTFTQAIKNVRYAYTDGYGYDRPIRKFFEIPALGTVLLCTPCAGLEHLGFVDHESAVVVSPDGIMDAVAWLSGSPEKAQQIASRGRDLIWQRHSLHARAMQISQCLAAIAQGKFRGSRWQRGEFIVEMPH